MFQTAFFRLHSLYKIVTIFNRFRIPYKEAAMTHLDILQQRAEHFTTLRRQIHQHPELGFEEQQTSALVASLLEEWGYEVHRGLAKTGVVGTLRHGSGPSIGLRADMDALPIVEANDCAWKSKIEGKFHGCGHDGHTVSLLAAAQRLAETKNFSGTVHLIFQPAEELLYGGRVMLDDGLFQQFPPAMPCSACTICRK